MTAKAVGIFKVADVDRETENWLASAEYDLETARQMHATGRYVYVVFMCHLAVEKVLKALVGEATGGAPPRTHDLVRLANLGGVSLDADLERFLAELTDAQTGTRYGAVLSQAVARYPEMVARRYLDRSAEVIMWLRSDPRLRI